jgi:hypothetical protein
VRAEGIASASLMGARSVMLVLLLSKLAVAKVL